MLSKSPILDKLNEDQEKAVTHWGSPLLILAGAGSGKTRALTHRAAWLILEKNFAPENLLLLTFTNKSAGEMKERILKLLASQNITGSPYAGTFHSFSARVLRESGKYTAIPAGFVIYDTNDQIDIVKEVFQILDIDPKRFSPQSALSAISNAKNELIDPAEYSSIARGEWQLRAAEVYTEYQKFLKRNEALDFDDLLFETVKLFRTVPDVLEKYQHRFKYVLVDEWQDTNKAQYAITKLLVSKHGGLTVVGDAAQCLLPGTKVHTLLGKKDIEKIEVGDSILAAAGRGKVHSVPVQKVRASNYVGKVFHIKTKSGRILKATPNHIFFARLSKTANKYYVYLMFRNDKGYRIGIAKTVRGVGLKNANTGLITRSNQESADKMWILRVCENRAEANFWEQWFVVEYGIPITQEQVDQLYKTIDTKQRAKKLFKDFYLYEDYPHHRPKGMASRISPDRQIVNFTLFSDKRPSIQSPWCGHRVSINTSHEPLKLKLNEFKSYIRGAKRNTWRIENVFWSYESTLELAEKVSQAGGGLPISYSAFIADDKKFKFTPVSHLRETMEVGTFHNGKIVVDEIVSIKTEEYQGKVYDLDVSILHNYIANGVVVHNSIYSWRGADYRNITYLTKDFPNLTTINLEQNYRSTQRILDAAHSVISRNKNHPILRLWTDNSGGERLKLYQARSELDEASFIAKEIQELTRKGVTFREMAVLYRTNAQSRVVEEALLHEGIPYILVGAVRFYERKEIKDVLAYLRLLVAPQDTVARKRIEKLGKGRVKRFDDFVENEYKQSLNEYKESFENSTSLEILDKVLQVTGILELYDPNNEEDLNRLENIKELRSVATEFAKLPDFLEQVILAESVQNPRGTSQMASRERGSAVTLMTAHAAKGLEFLAVFVVGLEEGLFPHSRALMDADELEEERRLMYVGITRAKQLLYLTFANRRLIFGSRQSSLPSRFLSEIPENLLEGLQGADLSFFDEYTSTRSKDIDW